VRSPCRAAVLRSQDGTLPPEAHILTCLFVYLFMVTISSYVVSGSDLAQGTKYTDWDSRGFSKPLHILHDHTSSTLLSPRAQSAGCSSFGKRVWFTESHIVSIISFLIVVLFTQFIVDKIKKVVLYKVKQLNHILSKQHSHFSVLPPTPHSYATDCLTGLLASVISC